MTSVGKHVVQTNTLIVFRIEWRKGASKVVSDARLTACAENLMSTTTSFMCFPSPQKFFSNSTSILDLTQHKFPLHTLFPCETTLNERESGITMIAVFFISGFSRHVTSDYDMRMTTRNPELTSWHLDVCHFLLSYLYMFNM